MVIYIKHNKYYCRFQVNGERHFYLCNGATTKSQAEKIENAFKYKVQQIQNGVLPRENKQNKVKMATLFNLYELYSKQNNKGYSKDIYSLNILRSYFKNDCVGDITLNKLEAFKGYLLNERHLANATVNRYRAMLSKIFNLGIQNKSITANPITDLKKLKVRNLKTRFLTLDEEARLYNTVAKTHPYLKNIITCALQTGMRKGEILNLKWVNIDMEYRFIELLETKSGKSRRIPISDSLYDVLNSLPITSEYVFVNPETNKPYTDLKRSFKTVLKQAGIYNFRFHDLRHTFATRLAECNIDLIVIKELLGHSKIDTTMRYAHAVPKRKIEAITILNSYREQREALKGGYKTDIEKLAI